MKRISLIILICLFGNFVPGYSQLKMTRYIHQKDYIDYGDEMFTKTTIDIYLLAIKGKIKAYADSTLGRTYDQSQLNKRTQFCEKVLKASSNEDRGEDTTICLPLDFKAVTFWLKIKTGCESVYNYPRLPVAAFCDSSGRQKLLFYINFQDIARFDSEVQLFLLDYLDFNMPHQLNPTWTLIDRENVKLYLKGRFATVANAIKSATPNQFAKLYDSDSLKTEFTPETFQKKKLELAGLSQNFDSDETIEIFLTEELSATDDGYKINEKSIGIGGDVQIGKSSLSDMPFFYMKYQDMWWKFFAFSSDRYFASSFGFLMNVSKYQVYKSITDMSWH